MKLSNMDQATSSETGYSGNVAGLSMRSKEHENARILATKFHIEPIIDSRLEFRINPIMKDLVINRKSIKKKWTKRQKKEGIVKIAKSVGENQPIWMDTLKDEIAKLK
jgi:hypothetical protein